MSVVEVPAAFIVITLGVVTQLALARSFDLFGRHFWLDEMVTYVTVADGSLRHAMGAIAGGLDTNPPGYHLLARGASKLAGRIDEASLRWFSVMCVVAALTGLYANVRLVCSPPIAGAMVLAMWQHPLILRFAFEARMYGLWLAGLAWFAYALTEVRMSPAEAWPPGLLAAASLLTCATHTLGPLTIGLIVGVDVIAHGAAALSWPALVAAAIGPIAFLAWTPFLWMQDTAITDTWINRPTAGTIAQCAKSLAPQGYLGAVLLLAGGLAPLLPAISLAPFPATVDRHDWPTLAGLAGLALLPLALLVLSHLLQPVLHERYAFPAVAAFAPAIAFVIAPVPTPWLLALCVVLFLSGAYEIDQLATGWRSRDRRAVARLDVLREHVNPGMVVFESLVDFAIVWRYARDLLDRCYVIDFEPGDASAVGEGRLASRNQSRIFAKYYPEWATLPWSTVRRAAGFHLVAAPQAHDNRFAQRDHPYPGFVATSLGAGLYDLEARALDRE